MTETKSKMDRVIGFDIYPKRLLSGGWTLYETTWYDRIVAARYGRRIARSRRRVWPECKQENGRGMVFESPRKAMLFYLEHKGDVPIKEGNFIWKRLRRMKLI